MFIKPLLTFTFAACAAAPVLATCYAGPGDRRDAQAATAACPSGQHFCCNDVDGVAWTRDGCTIVPKADATADSCEAVVYCAGSWTLIDGTVYCDD